MQGTWGRRVFGTVKRGPKYTRFRLEVKLDNGCTIYETQHVNNNELELFEGLYSFMLDEMTYRLEERIEERAQTWAQG
jgi:hypothetical protein